MRTIITTMIIFFMTCVVMVSAQSKFRQKRAWIIDSFTIEEESLGPFPYILGTINVERDYLVRYFLKGRGIDEDPKDVLSINFRTGEVLVHKKVDYETNRNLTFKFEARDEDYILDTNLRVVINILDINDNAPLFTLPYYETTLEESHLQGELVTTVSASDNDDPTTLNGIFEFALVSVTPKTDNVEFYITQSNTTGNIYFKGCLDYEKAQKYTLLIKATDSGEKVQLSSTSTVVLNIIDKNNHLPEITGHTGPGKIEERESGVEVLRLQVSDKDSRGSPAWKAKFTLHGDPENYFKIHTDPKTNEGILTVIKAMDHEEQTTRKMLVSVENELPYFLCKVKTRTPLHLWDVESNTSVPVLVKPFPVTITVDDVNDPPEFVPPVKIRLITENAKIGTLLETFTVIDPDKTHGNSFHFVKVVDEENWVTVDSLTGQVSVAKVMDRESPSVNHSRYGVIVHAVNKAQPPQTSTGTLIIQFIDENDNVPKLAVDTVSMCLSDEKTMTTISAVDPDLPPYSAPFQYELMEDDGMEGKWKLEPINETTVNLVKENTVYAGHYRIRIKISDNQRYGSVQNLSVTVCDCTGNFNCSVRSFRVQPSLRAIGVIIFTFLLLLAMLMMALMFCKTPVKTMILHDDAPGNLIQSNIEMPGTDCKLPFEIYQLLMSQRSVMMSNGFSKQNSMLHNGSTRYSYRQIQNDNMTTSVGKNGRAYYTDDFYKQVLSNQLDKSLLLLQAQEQEISDYEPHRYAYEEELDENLDPDLDPLTIPETDLQQDILTNLDSRFSNLAAVCRPDLMSSSQKILG
ncbi:cadherin-like protein 26 [Ictalurus punctatus]|uniref:Cadherin-like protein 26 n=1 Tax=Ictalurus punctatus TaxID=7998 RepID=A0A9F7RG42_ICTPU|nr:cadherin-like protein 26 [Ictalurus punctatus]